MAWMMSAKVRVASGFGCGREVGAACCGAGTEVGAGVAAPGRFVDAGSGAAGRVVVVANDAGGPCTGAGRVSVDVCAKVDGAGLVSAGRAGVAEGCDDDGVVVKEGLLGCSACPLAMGVAGRGATEGAAGVGVGNGVGVSVGAGAGVGLGVAVAAGACVNGGVGAALGVTAASDVPTVVGK